MNRIDEPAIRRSPMRGRVRFRVVLLLCVMYAIAYVDRTNIATAAPAIKADLHLTDSQLGLVLGAFSLPYALLQIFGGTIGSRFGGRRSLAVIAILWGVATMATGFSVGIMSLIGARLLLGLAESAAFPTATHAMTMWIPRDRNGYVQGVVHSASRLGNAVAPLVVAGLIAWAGWRSSFFVVALLSIAWAVAWLVLYRDDPRDHPRVTPIELAELPDRGRPAERTPVRWRALIRTMLPVVFVDFGYGWVLWVFLTWLPTFLGTTFDLDLKGFAVFTSLVLIGGVVGDTLGGLLTDRILARTGDVRRARRTSLQLGLIGSLLCLVPLLVTHELVVAAVSLAASFFFLELCNATLWAIPMDVAPQWAGPASGVMNTGFGIAGILSPIVFGVLVEHSGWVWPFGLSIALLAVAAVVATVMNPKPIEAAQPSVGGRS